MGSRGKVGWLFLALLLSSSFAFAANSAPYFTVLNDITTNEEHTYSTTFWAYDDDKDILSFSADNPWVTVTKEAADNGKKDVRFYVSFFGDDPEVLASPITVSITVNDGVNPPVSQPIQITVTNVNEAPVLGAISDFYVNVGQVFTYFLTATDEDSILGDILSFNVDNTFMKSKLNLVTGEINYVPQNGDFPSSPAQVRFWAKDSTNLIDWQDVLVYYNKAPIVNGGAGIPTLYSTEDVLFSYTVSATDPENNLPLQYYDDSTLFDIGLATGQFSFTPVNADLPGSPYWTTVWIVDSKGAQANSSFNMYVIEVNDLPVVDPLPAMTLAEDTPDTSVDMDDYVADEETADADIVWTNNGANVTATVAADGMLTLTPAADWCGNATIIFTATDEGGLSDYGAMGVEVLCGNDAPVVDVPDVFADEDSFNNSINLDDCYVDPDGDVPTWTWSGNVNINVAVDVDNIVTFTPPADWTGAETITFQADDGKGGIGSDGTLVTIVPVNDPPVVDPFPAIWIDEDMLNNTIGLDDYVADLESADADIVWSGNGANVQVSVDPLTRVLTLTPAGNWSGNESIILTATDEGGLTDSEAVNVSVLNVNDAPFWLAYPNNTETQEETQLIYQLYGSDPDLAYGDAISYAINGTAAVDANGLVTWTPSAGFNGIEYFEVNVTDLAGEVAWAYFWVNVTPVNDPPETFPMPDVWFDEDAYNDTLNMDAYVQDDMTPDASIVWTGTGTNVHATIDSNRQLNLTANANWAGNETITFTAADEGGLTNTTQLTVHVIQVNDAPFWLVYPTNQTVEEGGTVGFQVAGGDVDTPYGDVLAYGINGTATIDANGTIQWTAPGSFNGYEYFEVNVTDLAGEVAWAYFWVNVTPVNDPPETFPMPDVWFDEDTYNDTLVMDDYVTDDMTADADIVWTGTGTNVHAVIDSATRILNLTADADWAGNETITFTAMDGDGLANTTQLTVSVIQVNDAPFWVTYPANQTIAEGGTAAFQVEAGDADLPYGDAITYAINGTATIDSSGNIAWTPAGGFNGMEYFEVNATDSAGEVVWGYFWVNVTPVNDRPETFPMPDVWFDEDAYNDTLNMDAYVADDMTPDANIVWTGTGTNVHATIDSNRQLNLTADADWAGNETITFTAMDGDGLANTTSLTIHVKQINDAPFWLVYPQNQTIAEEGTLSMLLLASDADLQYGDAITYGVNDTTFTVGPLGGVSWTAPAGFNGMWHVEFNATDSTGQAVWAQIFVNVTEVNDAPVVTDIPDVWFVEDLYNDTISLDAYVTDDMTPDANINWTYSGNTNVVVSILADRTVNFTAAPNWSGSETITFTAADAGGLTDSDTVTVTVIGVEEAPYWDPYPANQTIAEDSSLDYTVHATDPDGQAVTYWINDTTITFNPATGQMTWTPGIGNTGIRYVTVNATDGTTVITAYMRVTVAPAAGRPDVGDIPNVWIMEDSFNNSIDLDNYIVDADTPLPSITWTASGNAQIAVAIDPLTHVATLTPAPNFYGVETITFTANDGTYTDSDMSVATVINVNDPPVLATLASDYYAWEYQQFYLDVNATDPDMPLDTLRFYSNSPLFTIDQNSGIISVVPVHADAGIHMVNISVRDTVGLEDSKVVRINVTVTPIPDVRVVNVTYVPSVVIEKDVMNFTAAIKNEGERAESSLVVRLFVDGIQKDSYTIPNLAVGATTNVPFSWASTQYNHSFVVSVDPVSGETDTVDNQYPFSKRVYSYDEVLAIDVLVPSQRPQNSAFVSVVNVWNTAKKAQYNIPVNLTLDNGLVFGNNDVDWRIIPFIDVNKSTSLVWYVNSTSQTGVFNVRGTIYQEVTDVGQVTVS
ncbi:MAG: tandem-95 repeat protein [archaeon]